MSKISSINLWRSQVGKVGLPPLEFDACHPKNPFPPGEKEDKTAGASHPSRLGICCSWSLVRGLRVSLTVVLLLSLLITAACASGQGKPVAIDKDDMCTFCRMAISEKRYAAEVIDKDGQAIKFDDITCMTNYVNFPGRPEKLAAYFVIDFNTLEWTKAEEAHYVKSLHFQTPMNGGVVAFKDQTAAEKAVVRFLGTALTFADLTAKEQ